MNILTLEVYCVTTIWTMLLLYLLKRENLLKGHNCINIIATSIFWPPLMIIGILYFVGLALYGALKEIKK